MSWFDKLLPSVIRTEGSAKKAVPEGLWNKCPGCGAILYRAEMERNMDVCPKCGHHNRIGARRRLDLFLDKEPRHEIGANLQAQDPLKFKDSKKYKDRLAAAQKATGEKDALIVIEGALKAYICFSASGGARMQESLFSLFQMAKTSAVLKRMAGQGIPFISVMTDPTMGGVSASLAMLGDVNIAEPGALIGFAGPRVIEQTVREKLPEGFQRSEFLLEHGAIDMIVPRNELRDRIHNLLSMLNHHTDSQ